MANPSPIVNERPMEQVLAITEASYGAGGTPSFRLYGDLKINSQRPLIKKPQYRRSYDGMRGARRSIWDHTGTYADDLSYEDLAILMRYGAAPSPTPVDDGNSVHGYTRTYIPALTMPESLAPEHAVNGLVMAATGVYFDDFTVSHSVDDADGNWKISANLAVRTNALKAKATHTATGGTTTTAVKAAAGWTPSAFIGQYVAFRTGTAANIDEIREITANDATSLTFAALPAAVVSTDTFDILAPFTASIADRNIEYIANEGTKLYMADAYASIASNEVKDKMIGFSVQVKNNARKKRFSNNVGGYSKKRGRDMREVTVQITMEFDDPKEREIFESQLPKARAIRLEQTGSVINVSPATNKLAQINLPSVQWDAVDSNQYRQSNKIAVYQGVAFADGDAVAFGGVVGFLTKTTLSVLP